MNGLLLAFQFFTIVPIKKELPLGKKEVTFMYCMLPVIGAFIGLTVYGVYLLSGHVLEFTPFLTAVLLVVTGFVLSGGLHLDGFADTADAFFSYKTAEKRFAILDDPRLGAFGTMALIFLVVVKIALIYEAVTAQIGLVYAFIFIPLIARALLAICFAVIPTAKEKGIAFFFKEKIHEKVVVLCSTVLLILTILLYAFFFERLGFAMLLFMLFGSSIVLFKRWSMKQFNGITGDLAGAYIEGMEVLLWGIALFLL